MWMSTSAIADQRVEFAHRRFDLTAHRGVAGTKRRKFGAVRMPRGSLPSRQLDAPKRAVDPFTRRQYASSVMVRGDREVHGERQG
jgi:hypothetical protein